MYSGFCDPKLYLAQIKVDSQSHPPSSVGVGVDGKDENGDDSDSSGVHAAAYAVATGAEAGSGGIGDEEEGSAGLVYGEVYHGSPGCGGDSGQFVSVSELLVEMVVRMMEVKRVTVVTIAIAVAVELAVASVVAMVLVAVMIVALVTIVAKQW